MRAAPDRIVIISAAAPLRTDGGPAPFAAVQLTRDSRDITSLVRAERLAVFYVFLFVTAASLLLSNYLASTIVRPLRQLARAALQVRLGRARDVTVPRFNQRRDEIGQLARALSDMTLTLRDRIDATEAFAADVAHEIKNPLASLSSAVDTFGRVSDPGLQAQLLDVIRTDVGRIDRLITDIADASRLDAELSRSRFDAVDLGEEVARLVAGYATAGLPRGVTVTFDGPARPVRVWGDAGRLAQVARNLIDNAVVVLAAGRGRRRRRRAARARRGADRRRPRPRRSRRQPRRHLPPLLFRAPGGRGFRAPFGARPRHRPDHRRRP